MTEQWELSEKGREEQEQREFDLLEQFGVLMQREVDKVKAESEVLWKEDEALKADAIRLAQENERLERKYDDLRDWGSAKLKRREDKIKQLRDRIKQMTNGSTQA